MQRCMVYSTPLVCSWARVCNKPWAPLPLELVCSKPTNYEMRYRNIYNDYSVMNKYNERLTIIDYVLWFRFTILGWNLFATVCFNFSTCYSL